MREALQLYRQAGLLERRGNLNEALKLYRQAVKKQPEIEGLIHDQSSERGRAARALLQLRPEDLILAPSFGNADLEERAFQVRSGEQGGQSQQDTEDLVQLFGAMAVGVQPRSKPGRQTVHISQIPAEIMVDYVLTQLILDDPASVELFGRVCKTYFVYARDQKLWKYACEHVHRHLGPLSPMAPGTDYRSLFMDTPRVRHEGVYISRCTYMRQGLSESSFLQPIHLVTYYRYLRFYRDGTVMSVLTAQEPAQVVHKICKSKAAQQQIAQDKEARVLQGHYTLDGIGKHVRVVVSDPVYNNGGIFHSHLSLGCTYRGGWNKLAWRDYYRVAGVNNESTPFSLKQFKSYFFSRVKSYLHEK